MEETENLEGRSGRATFRAVHQARDGEGASAAGHGTAAGEQAPRWESPTAIDGQRPRERAGTAVVAGLRGHRGRGGGEEGRGPRTTTRGGEPWLSVERARGGDRRGYAVSFEETGPCQGRGERRASRAPDTG